MHGRPTEDPVTCKSIHNQVTEQRFQKMRTATHLCVIIFEPARVHYRFPQSHSDV